MTDALRTRIDAITAAQIQPRGPRSAVMGVHVPRHGFEHASAAGIARADTGRPAVVGDRFHVASVGKMFTAVLVTRAAEAGLFGPDGIDTALGELAVAPRHLVEAIHPAGPTITLRHLLTHTSGMKDNVTDDATGTALELGGPPPDSLISRYVRSMSAARRGGPDDGISRHRWTPWDPDRPNERLAGILNDFIASGTAAAPVGAPGERFHYSDTAFVLLGVLLELATGRRYHELQREQIISPLGLHDTALAYYDDTSPTARDDEMDIWLGSVPLLSAGFDVSFDWSGGGQVSTVADLLRFLEALLDPGSGLMSERYPLTEWTMPDGLTPPRRAIGLGLFRWDVGHRVVVGHAGAWGVRVFHDPLTDAWLAGTVNERDEGAWVAEIFDAVEDELQ